ncbi:hypothetical protein [Mammaliicoccus sciuri]|uniref:hypothetical protein n=1 Tax=Mammaliicoccus sciuri TaxID=1296 RepID=UPI00177D9AE0|nr:hypothetical protein [Mammaliicoccus sciuri]MCD8797422.1 hypothetical protein [Mammaliicoccus sciuri]
MKKLLVLLFASLLVLGACGQNMENAKDDKDIDLKPDKDNKKSDKKEKKSEKEDKDKESTKKTEPKTEEKSTEEVTTEEPQSVEEDTTEERTQEQQSVQEQPNTSNITDEGQLQNVLNGNYSEEQKIQAYNSAVANGVIPQGTVSEGSAQAAYESSKGIQNGDTTKDQLAERYQSWVDAGIMTEEEMQKELAKQP